MKKIFIVANSQKIKTLECADKIKKYIEDKNGTAWISRNKISGDGTYVDRNSLPEDVEGIIVLGGDGTLIQTARDLLDFQLPMLGVNLGTLGYLAQIEQEEAFDAVDMLMADKYELEKRILLRGEVIRNGEVIYSNLGINDIVLNRGGDFRIVDFSFFVNGEFLTRYHADGMILSTPTGSTAYNLSAGGPIVMPDAEIIVATPINPHSLNSRSIVFPADVEIILELGGIVEDTPLAIANLDASQSPALKKGDKIRIVKSKYNAKFIKLKKESFLETLRKKINN